jgi:hypothetical protein
MAVATSTNRYAGGPSPSGLADVLDLILDKGLVIDLYVRVSLIGIEILTIDARIVVASVDTYLRFAEAVGRMNIEESDSKEGLPELMQSMTSGGAKSKTSGALEGVKEQFQDAIGSGSGSDDEEEGSDAGRERERERPRRRRRERDEE